MNYSDNDSFNEITQLEKIIEKNESDLSRLENDRKKFEENYNFWQKCYNQECNAVITKRGLCLIITVVVLMFGSILNLITSFLWFVFIFVFGIFFGFVISWDDADSRNHSKVMLDAAEKEFFRTASELSELKEKIKKDKSKYDELRNICYNNSKNGKV
jgi:general stress protein CsbA